MTGKSLTIIPITAPVQSAAFNLAETLLAAMASSGYELEEWDVLAVSSKYMAISENRIVDLETVTPTDNAIKLSTQYNMDARLAQLVIDESDHIFGGIKMGFLLTHTAHGVISPNAGLDRSNIPAGKVVLLPKHPFESTATLRSTLQQVTGKRIGIVLTDSWLMPGRYGTTGVAIAAAGFEPLQDERGKPDLFGNPMQVTRRSIADQLTTCAEMVMGERDEATPLAIIRNASITFTDRKLSSEDIAIPWQQCIYVESLTAGALSEVSN